MLSHQSSLKINSDRISMVLANIYTHVHYTNINMCCTLYIEVLTGRHEGFVVRKRDRAVCNEVPDGATPCELFCQDVDLVEEEKHRHHAKKPARAHNHIHCLSLPAQGRTDPMINPMTPQLGCRINVLQSL